MAFQHDVFAIGKSWFKNKWWIQSSHEMRGHTAGIPTCLYIYWLHPDCTWTAGAKFVPKSTWCFNHTSPGLFCALALRDCCFGTWESCWASNDVKKSSLANLALKVCWLWNQWVKNYCFFWSESDLELLSCLPKPIADRSGTSTVVLLQLFFGDPWNAVTRCVKDKSWNYELDIHDKMFFLIEMIHESQLCAGKSISLLLDRFKKVTSRIIDRHRQLPRGCGPKKAHTLPRWRSAECWNDIGSIRLTFSYGSDPDSRVFYVCSH